MERCISIYKTVPLKVLICRDNGYRYVNLHDLLYAMSDTCDFSIALPYLHLYDISFDYFFKSRTENINMDRPDDYTYVYMAIPKRNVLKIGDKNLARWLYLCAVKKPKNTMDSILDQFDNMNMNID